MHAPNPLSLSLSETEKNQQQKQPGGLISGDQSDFFFLSAKIHKLNMRTYRVMNHIEEQFLRKLINSLRFAFAFSLSLDEKDMFITSCGWLLRIQWSLIKFSIFSSNFRLIEEFINNKSLYHINRFENAAMCIQSIKPLQFGFVCCAARVQYTEV